MVSLGVGEIARPTPGLDPTLCRPKTVAMCITTTLSLSPPSVYVRKNVTLME